MSHEQELPKSEDYNTGDAEVLQRLVTHLTVLGDDEPEAPIVVRHPDEHPHDVGDQVAAANPEYYPNGRLAKRGEDKNVGS